jgi:hypothetical protein
MSTVLSCTNCGQRLRVPTGIGPLWVTCPKCRYGWQWSNLVGSDGTAEESRGQATTPRPEKQNPKTTATKTEKGEIEKAKQGLFAIFYTAIFSGVSGLAFLWGSISIFLGRTTDKEPNTTAPWRWID